MVDTANGGCTTPSVRWGLAPQFDIIPPVLHALPWAVWKAEPRENQPGKMNKAPRCSRQGYKIKTDTPSQWGNFQQAQQAYTSGRYDGVGMLLVEGSGIVALDVDCTLDNSPEHAMLKAALANFLKRGGYVERSPSGTGYHAYFRGELDPSWPKKAGGIELYDRVRFMTVTGHRVEVLNV